jgi:putative pyrroloquinoline-quinone binding quinoprotein
MVRYRAVAISIIPLLVVSTVLGILAVPPPAHAAASTADNGANWAFPNYNLNGTNDSPQTEISPSNVHSLVMNWTIPMPATDPSWSSVNSQYCYPNCATWAVEPGADSPPLIVQGIVYFVTNQGVLYALSSVTGAQVWTKTITANFQTALKTVPLIETQIGAGAITPCSSTACTYNDTFWCSTTTNPAINCASPVEHKHAIDYLTINGHGIISVTGFDCEVWGFKADTGDVAYHITNMCVNVPGNGGGAYPATYASDPPEYYNGMLVYVMGGYTDIGGRTFLAAYNATAVLAAGAKGYNGACAANSGTYTLGTLEGTCPPAVAGQGPMWMVYLQPPSTGDSNWDNEACSVGWVFDYPAFTANGTKAIPCTQIPNSVKNIGATSTSPGGDWGVPKAAASGVSTTWGQMAIDNKTGIMYFGTGEAGPFEYCYGSTCPSTPNERPGLNLYSSAEMAVDLHTGKIVWWFQMLPHGLSDWDASWSTVLGTTNGHESIFKATKDGILFSLNATNGAPNWVFVNPAIKWAPGLTPLDPTSPSAMMSPWPNYPNPTWIQAPSLAGSLEEDLAYDGQNIYGAWFNSSPNVETINNQTQYAATVKTLAWPDNVTVTAVDANTGKPVWSRFFDGFVFRGGMTVTNGMLVMPTGNGTIFFLSTKDGSTISKLYIGSPLFVDPTLGQAANGQMMLYQIIGGGRWLGVGQVGGTLTQPGALMAFSLASGIGTGPASTSVSTSVVAVQSNLPLNYIAYAAVTFAIIVTVANVVIRGRKVT